MENKRFKEKVKKSKIKTANKNLVMHIQGHYFRPYYFGKLAT